MAPPKSYDLFISFLEADVRQNLLTHLCAAFKAKGVNVLLDEKLEKGEATSPGLLKAIEESKVSLIIFSKDYASSSSCLKQLVKIMECRSNYNQKVIPVFYGVETVHVEHQTGSYEEAFIRHEKEIKDQKMIKLWRKVLTEASLISGWDSATIRNDATLVKEIVNDIARKLSKQEVLDNPRYVPNNYHNTCNRNERLPSQSSGSNAYNTYKATTSQRSSNVRQTRSQSQQPFSSRSFVINHKVILQKMKEDSANRVHALARETEERQSTSQKANVNNSDAEMRKREVQTVSDQLKQSDMQRLGQINNMLYRLNNDPK